MRILTPTGVFPAQDSRGGCQDQWNWRKVNQGGGEHILSRWSFRGLTFVWVREVASSVLSLPVVDTCGLNLLFLWLAVCTMCTVLLYRVCTVFEAAKNYICLALLFAGMASPCLMWLWYHPLSSLRAGASSLLSFIIFYCGDLGSDSRSQVEEIISQFPFIDLLPCDRKSVKYFTNVYMYTVIVLSFSVIFLDLVILSGRGGFIFYLTDYFDTENGQGV